MRVPLQERNLPLTRRTYPLRRGRNRSDLQRNWGCSTHSVRSGRRHCSESRAIDSANTVRVGVLGAGQAHVFVGVVVGVDGAVLGAARRLVEPIGKCPWIYLHMICDATDAAEGVVVNVQILQTRQVAHRTWLELRNLVAGKIEIL